MERLDKLDFSKNGINVYWFDNNENQVFRKAFVHIDTMRKYIEQTPDDQYYKLVLECSTAGDARFSAFGAKVKAFGIKSNIEFHYQFAKGFEGLEKPKITDTWEKKMNYIKSIKGKPFDYFDLNGKKLDSELIFQWYHLLWINYLDNNPELVEYLRLFDDYNDVFKGKSKACQADSIRKYIKDGRESLLEECQELNSKFKNPIK
jgi:hypothetical protein